MSGVPHRQPTSAAGFDSDSVIKRSVTRCIRNLLGPRFPHLYSRIALWSFSSIIGNTWREVFVFYKLQSIFQVVVAVFVFLSESD